VETTLSKAMSAIDSITSELEQARADAEAKQTKSKERPEAPFSQPVPVSYMASQPVQSGWQEACAPGTHYQPPYYYAQPQYVPSPQGYPQHQYTQYYPGGYWQQQPVVSMPNAPKMQHMPTSIHSVQNPPTFAQQPTQGSNLDPVMTKLA